MVQIAPHRALTRLSTDCSVWLQIESEHARDFVSFCQPVLKTMVWQTQTTFVWRGRSSLKIQVWSRSAVSPSSSIIKIGWWLWHTEWNSMPQYPVHPISQWLYISWITVGLEMSYHSSIKCHQPTVKRATLCVLCVCVGMHYAWHHDPMQSTAKRISKGQICKFFANRVVSRLNMFFISSLSYCLSVWWTIVLTVLPRKSCTSSANFIWHAGILTFTTVTEKDKWNFIFLAE